MLSPLGDALRRHDPDRFLTVLFAPPERREVLITLYAFNHELARAREVASQALLALIRLQWWREVVEGEAKAHEVGTPLLALIADGRLDRSALLALIEAREAEVDGDLPTMDAWRGWLLAGAGGSGGPSPARRGLWRRRSSAQPASARSPGPGALAGRSAGRARPDAGGGGGEPWRSRHDGDLWRPGGGRAMLAEAGRHAASRAAFGSCRGLAGRLCAARSHPATFRRGSAPRSWRPDGGDDGRPGGLSESVG
jgi:hypothetical protein